MRLSIISAAFVAFTGFTSALIATPSSQEFEVDVSKRDLSSIVSDLLDGHIVADVISKINYEKIAGYADDILDKDDNVKYLDDLLVGLKNTDIIPKLAVKLVTSNKTLAVVEKTLPILLSYVGEINATSFFVALDRSGLAYSVVAGALEDTKFLPSVLNVSKKLIKSSKLNLTAILDKAGEYVEDKFTRDLAFEQDPEESVYDLVSLDKRDNIEELLSTVLESVDRSGLINETVTTLLSNDEFTDGAIVLIQGVLEDIGSSFKGANFTSLKPILTSLWSSNLLQDTITRALNDSDLRKALEKDLGSLLHQGTIKTTDLVSKDTAEKIVSKSGYSADSTISATADASAIQSLGTHFQSYANTRTTKTASNSAYPSESSAYSASATGSKQSTKTSDSGSSNLINTNPKILSFFGLLGFSSILLI